MIAKYFSKAGLQIHKLLNQETYDKSETLLNQWATDIKDTAKYYELMGYCWQLDASIYTLVENGISTEELEKIIDLEHFQKYARQPYGWTEIPETKELAQLFKELLTPGAALEKIMAPFKDPAMMAITDSEIAFFHSTANKSSVYSTHKDNFSKGLAELANMRLPKEDTVKLIEFMSQNEVFCTFLKDHEELSASYLRGSSLPWTIGNLCYEAREEEEDSIRAAIKKCPILNEVFDSGFAAVHEFNQCGYPVPG